jgi:oxygen-independent coproporphyrinogen-3 oxidase
LKSKDLIIRSICDEIKLRSSELNEDIHSIYFGGGTPSIMNKSNISLILNTIHDSFKIIKNPEVTLECNPDDINLSKIESWKSSKINRISLGVQSFNSSDLLLMNRSHSSDQALSSLNLVMQNFENFSVDLIYGIPSSSISQWKKNLEILIDNNVPHISTYALTVEPKTALKKLIENKKIDQINETDQRIQYDFTYKTLSDFGYVNYEFSSFAKPGFECQNNLGYWERKKYIGFGPSAHSFDGKYRKWNISNNQLYFQSIENKKLPQKTEYLNEKDVFNEIMMIGLRRSTGINIDDLKLKFDQKFIDHFLNEISLKINDGILIKKENKIYTSDEYKFMTDGIASDLFITD